MVREKCPASCVKKFLDITYPYSITTVDEGQANSHHDFRGRIALSPVFQPAKIGLIDVGILSYLITEGVS